MKIKHIFAVGALLLSGMAAFADGYYDGIEYYKAGQYDNARTILMRNLNAAGTDQALAHYYLGQIDLRDGNAQAAQANFEKGIAINPECPYNYVGMGAIQLLKGQPKQAESYFKDAVKFDKKNYEILVDIARAYFNADPVKYDAQVQKYLTDAHKKSKNQEPTIYVLEGDMLFSAGDIGGAAAKYEQAITWDEDNPEGYVKYANAYRGVNPAFSVQKLEELVQKQPSSALAQRQLAEMYYENNQWSKAAQQYGRYIQNPNHFPEDKARYAVLLFANQDYDTSLGVVNEMLAATPNDFLMQRLRLLNLNGLERFEEAEAAAQSFFALPESGNAVFTANDYITYSNVLTKLEKPEEAIAAFEKAVAVNPDNTDLLKTLSQMYAAAQKYQEAAETLDRYLATSDKADLNDWFTASGRWLQAAGDAIKAQDQELRDADADKGIEAINHVIENVSTPRADFLIRLGRFYIVKNNNLPGQDALEIYQKAIELLDQDPANAQNAAGLKNYVECYRILGNYYQLNDMTEQQNEAYRKMDEYNALLQQQ